VLAVSLVCVGAFTNAMRGTFGYRRMVATHVAADKQDAITAEDLAAIKGKISGIFHKSGGAVLPRPAVPRSQPRTAAVPPPPAPAAPPYSPSPKVSKSAPAAPAEPPPTPAAPADVPADAEVAIAPAPLRKAFAATIGVSGGLIYWPRVGAFFLANLAAGLTFLIGRSMTTSFSVPPIYWLFAICLASVFTAATVAGFRFLSNAWAAAGAAALAATLASLPFYAMLSSFAWADLFYREQFQQFILLPFVNSFILLMALVWVVPRLQPMVLALWLGAMGTEIATSLVANLLHALGAGDSPDAVLGGASVISAVLRSLAFALGLWGGLQYLRKKARRRCRVEAAWLGRDARKAPPGFALPHGDEAPAARVGGTLFLSQRFHGFRVGSCRRILQVPLLLAGDGAWEVDSQGEGQVSLLAPRRHPA
jgi:hypothetical protein